jgi:UDPglucose 6-dehydrogenase
VSGATEGAVIGFAGMTHLGLVSAIAAAEKGCRVVCFDPDAALCARLDQGILPVVEPDLDETAARNRIRLTYSADPAALSACDVVYLAPDVATDDQGVSDLSGICSLMAQVEPGLDTDTVLVVLSQVPPGFTRTHLKPARLLFYQVETLIFGCALERALHPERFIVGAERPEQPLPPAYRAFLERFGCPILPMRFESAELTKISINCCLVASISVANTLAELCERIGADWSEIAPALRLDRRIGQHSYLSPGLGIAGGNLERDLATIVSLADRHNTEAGVVRAWIGNSRHRRSWPLTVLGEAGLLDRPDLRIGVLGLAYKENTHSIKNSPALALIAGLPTGTVTAYDPVVSVSVAPGIRQAASPEDVWQGADAVVIATPWPQFRSLVPRDIAVAMRGQLLIDPYRILDPSAAVAAGLDYRTLGAAAAAR